MGSMVIACYRPKPGQAEALLAEVRQHVPILRRIGLATHRPALAMRAQDGTIVEVFEWVSKEAIATAHGHPEVLAMWGRYEPLCDYVAYGSLAEAAQLFPDLEPLDL